MCLHNLICSCSCSASVGYQGYQQFVNLAPGCWHMGTVAHEIGTWFGKRVEGGGGGWLHRSAPAYEPVSLLLQELTTSLVA